MDFYQNSLRKCQMALAIPHKEQIIPKITDFDLWNMTDHLIRFQYHKFFIIQHIKFKKGLIFPCQMTYV